MASGVKLTEKFIENLQLICTSLERNGFQCIFMITSPQATHKEIGSEKGRQFIERFDLVKEFHNFCKGFIPTETTEHVKNKERQRSQINQPLELESKLVCHQPKANMKQIVCHSVIQMNAKCSQPLNKISKLVLLPEDKQISYIKQIPKSTVNHILHDENDKAPHTKIKQIPNPEQDWLSNSKIKDRSLSMSVSEGNSARLPGKLVAPHSSEVKKSGPGIEQVSSNMGIKMEPGAEIKQKQHEDKETPQTGWIWQIPFADSKVPPRPVKLVLYSNGKQVTLPVKQTKIKQSQDKATKQTKCHENESVQDPAETMYIATDSPANETSSNKIEQSPDTATKQTKSSENEQVQYPAMVSIARISHVNETSSNQTEQSQDTATKQTKSSKNEPVQDPAEKVSNATVSPANETSSKQKSLGDQSRRRKKKRRCCKIPTIECDKCDRKFVYRTSLWKHQRRHAMLKHLKCINCEKSFTQIKELKQHESIHDIMKSKNAIKCTLCDKKYATFYAFYRHLVQNHPKMFDYQHLPYEPCFSDQIFECYRCNEKFHFVHALKVHNRQKHGLEKLSLKCVNCSRVFISLASLIRHEAAAHKTTKSRKFYHCNDCDIKFITFNSYYTHRRNHHSGLRDFKGTVKVQNDKYRNTLVVCPMCGKTYNQLVIKKHINQVHSTNIFTCKTCNKKFKTIIGLKCHERIHSGDAHRLICDLCGITIAHASSLVRHKLRRHSKKRRQKCESCDRSYCYPSELREHKRLCHTGYQQDM